MISILHLSMEEIPVEDIEDLEAEERWPRRCHNQCRRLRHRTIHKIPKLIHYNRETRRSGER